MSVVSMLRATDNQKCIRVQNKTMTKLTNTTTQRTDSRTDSNSKKRTLYNTVNNSHTLKNHKFDVIL